MSKQLEYMLGQCINVVAANITAKGEDLRMEETQDSFIEGVTVLFSKMKAKKIQDLTEE